VYCAFSSVAHSRQLSCACITHQAYAFVCDETLTEHQLRIRPWPLASRPVPELQRLLDCVYKGFSAVALDRIHSPSNGLGLTTTDYAAHLTWAAGVVTSWNLSVGAVDGGALLASNTSLVGQLSFGATQECVRLGTCDQYASYGGWLVVSFVCCLPCKHIDKRKHSTAHGALYCSSLPCV